MHLPILMMALPCSSSGEDKDKSVVLDGFGIAVPTAMRGASISKYQNSSTGAINGMHSIDNAVKMRPHRIKEMRRHPLAG